MPQLLNVTNHLYTLGFIIVILTAGGVFCFVYFYRWAWSLQQEIEIRKQAEEQLIKSETTLQTIFNGISDPLIMVDNKMSVRMVNVAAKKYLQIPFRKDITDKHFLNVIRGESDRKVSEAILSGQNIMFERKGFMDPDRVEEVNIFSIPEKEGGVPGAIIHIKDITEKKQIGEQIIRTDRLASLGQLSGGIAHEIRNPLSSINLFVDILCDKDKFDRTETELEIFAEIKDGINRIHGIIKRILDFARPSTGELKEVDINFLIRDNLKPWSVKIGKSKIRLELLLAEDLPRVLCDAVALQQVMNNLVLNAVEEMDKGGVLRITTSKGRSSFRKNRKVVVIDVKDTGPGIKAEHHKDIFDPFFTTKANGTGLGLAISHQIIERHDGFLRFESKPKEGTTFTIELPAIDGE